MTHTRKVTIEELVGDYPTYAEGCLKIVNKNSQLVSLVMNHSQSVVQAAVDRCERAGRPIRIIELKARQTGLSTDAEGRIFHRCHLRRHRQALIVAHKDEAAKKIFRMSRIFYDNLPPGPLKLKSKYFTKGLIEFDETGSAFQVAVANKMGGRGFTAPYLHLSEVAFYPNVKDVIAGVLQTAPSTPDSIVILESTPNGHNEFYDVWQAAKAGENDFIPIFLPWFGEPSYVKPVPKNGLGQLDDDELELKEKYTLSDEQLSWRRWCIRNNCFGDPEVFLQEYPSDDRSCFLASGRPAFDRKGIRHYILMSGLEPNDAGERATVPPLMDLSYDPMSMTPVFKPSTIPGQPGKVHGCRIYRHPQPRVLYTMGADIAEGVRGGARSSISILNRLTLDYDFFWYGWTPPEQLLLYMDWIGRWYNDALAIPEFNNHGYTVVSGLVARAYPNMWIRPASFDTSNPMPGDKYGYPTNLKTRHYLFDGMREYVRNQAIPENRHATGRLEDPECVGEMLTSIYDKDRVDHLAGKMNDVVLAAALALFGHRGSAEAPLRPLDLVELRDLLEPVRLGHGARSRLPANELLAHGITADDLARLDEEESERRRRPSTTGGRQV